MQHAPLMKSLMQKDVLDILHRLLNEVCTHKNPELSGCGHKAVHAILKLFSRPDDLGLTESDAKTKFDALDQHFVKIIQANQTGEGTTQQTWLAVRCIGVLAPCILHFLGEHGLNARFEQLMQCCDRVVTGNIDVRSEDNNFVPSILACFSNFIAVSSSTVFFFFVNRLYIPMFLFLIFQFL
jgi:hypothetical protein